METILLSCKKILFRIMKSLVKAFAWLMLSIFLTFALTKTVSLFATERYQQGNTPHPWFSVVVYTTDEQGERFPTIKSPEQLTPQDELWQESESYLRPYAFAVDKVGEQTYELEYEIGLGMAYSTYRIENGRVVPLSFDHQWYVSVCMLVALFISAYLIGFISRKIRY